MKSNKRILARRKRHMRLRKNVTGSMERPRMNVSCTLKHIYIQFIDDIQGKTILSCCTTSKDFTKTYDQAKSNIKTAKALGEFAAIKAQDKGIKKIVFDRGGFQYHGKVKVIADAARSKGLVF